MIEQISWRAVFFINLPLAILIVVISFWHVPESSNDEKGRLDWLGAILTALGLGTLVYGLIESSELGFAHPAVLSTLAAAVVTLAIFVVVEARVRNPMLPFTLFRSRTFTGANLLTLLLYGALGGTLFFLPLNLIQVQRYSATAAGAALLPLILIIFLLSRWSGGLVQRCGAKIPLIIGPLIAAAGFGLFVLPAVGGSYWRTFFPAVVVLGIGMAVSVAPLTTTVMNSVAPNRVGIASGVNNAVSRTAGLLAIAVLGIVMLQTFNRSLDARLAGLKVAPLVQQSLNEQRTKLAGAQLPESIEPHTRALLVDAINQSFVDGFRRVMLVGAALALGSAITALVLIDGTGKTRSA